jgi:hypothetical protein
MNSMNSFKELTFFEYFNQNHWASNQRRDKNCCDARMGSRRSSKSCRVHDIDTSGGIHAKRLRSESFTPSLIDPDPLLASPFSDRRVAGRRSERFKTGDPFEHLPPLRRCPSPNGRPPAAGPAHLSDDRRDCRLLLVTSRPAFCSVPFAGDPSGVCAGNREMTLSDNVMRRDRLGRPFDDQMAH